MDTFTFAISIVVMMIGLQFGQNWIVFGIIALMVISSRDIPTIIMMVASGIVLYAFQGLLAEYWPFILFGLVILAFMFSPKQDQGGGEMYAPDPHGGMLGQPGMGMGG